MANRFDATAASSLSPGDGTRLIKRLVARPADTIHTGAFPSSSSSCHVAPMFPGTDEGQRKQA